MNKKTYREKKFKKQLPAHLTILCIKYISESRNGEFNRARLPHSSSCPCPFLSLPNINRQINPNFISGSSFHVAFPVRFLKIIYARSVFMSNNLLLKELRDGRAEIRDS